MVTQIVQKIGIEEDSVLVLLDRSQPPETIRVNVRIEAISFKPIYFSWKRIFETRANIEHNSSSLEKAIQGRSFHAYLPSDSGYNCQQILHHPNCLQYCLFEEGLASYSQPGEFQTGKNPPNLRTRIKSRIIGSGRVYHPHTIHMLWREKYAGSYSSNGYAFPEFPKPVWNLNANLFNSRISNINKILVLDDLSEFPSDLQSIYLSRIEELIRSLNTQNEHWAYKLHPVCEDWPWLKERIDAIFQPLSAKGSTWIKLERSDCIEELGASANVMTYGYLSSCLLYIHLAGGETTCLKDHIEQSDPRFKEIWKRIVPTSLDCIFNIIPRI